MNNKPYICPFCGHQFTTQSARCIGEDGMHRPTVVIVNRAWEAEVKARENA
jgi:hypothetical protein